jgi:hypothetical protein
MAEAGVSNPSQNQKHDLSFMTNALSEILGQPSCPGQKQQVCP